MDDFKIQSILNTIKPQQETNKAAGIDKTDGKSFADVLKETIQEVNELQLESDEAMTKFATGETTDVHNTMLAMQKADISFQTMMQIRNKILDAYKEIMRTQV